jgi:hypothetical protein
MLPAPIGWGNERRGQCHERVLSLHRRARQSPHCHTALAKPGSGIPANGFIDRRLWTPHAFRGFDLKARPGTDCSSRSPDEGRALDFRLFARPEHPCREANDHRSRPDRSPSPSLDPAPRSALRLRLETAPRCLESTSTTDVSRHEHPCEHHLWRPSAGLPWGNPAGSRLRDPSRARRFHRRSSRTPDHLAVIQPPAVARLTARRPASGHAAIPGHDGEGACARTSSWLSRGNETAAALSAGGRFRRANPLTPLSHVWRARSRSCVVCHSPGAVQSGHVNAADFPELEGAFRRRSPLPETLASSFNGALPSLAGKGSRCTCSPVFSKSSKASKAPTRPAGAPLSRAFRGPHALLRLLQMKCFHEHDDGPLEHPRPPNLWVGRLPFNDRG